MTVSPLPTVGPTATPTTYVVQEGDTLIGIAFRYAITLEALQVANPGISAYTLQPGQALVLPIDPGSTGINAPAATPIPLSLGMAACYETPVGSFWCFLEAENLGEVPVENVSAAVTLIGAGGQALTSAVAISPLNLLLGRDAILLAVLFQPLEAEIAGVATHLLTAESIPGWEERYLPVEISEGQVEGDGAHRTVTGQVRLMGELPARLAKLVLVLHDHSGQVAGYRELKFPDGLAPGVPAAFRIGATALGGTAASHRLYAEAQP